MVWYSHLFQNFPQFIVTHTVLVYIGEGNGNPLQYSCLENSWIEEPGGLLSMGLHIVRHDWSDFTYIYFYFTILYWFCHTSTWICHRYTRVPHPEIPSLLPPHTIPLGRLSAPAPSILYPASILDWRFVSYMILYMFQCHSPKSSHPLPLPQSPKDCSIHLCLFCCLAYRVMTIFLNSIYMH